MAYVPFTASATKGKNDINTLPFFSLVPAFLRAYLTLFLHCLEDTLRVYIIPHQCQGRISMKFMNKPPTSVCLLVRLLQNKPGLLRWDRPLTGG